MLYRIKELVSAWLRQSQATAKPEVVQAKPQPQPESKNYVRAGNTPFWK
jgi:hypothetical protein